MWKKLVLILLLITWLSSGMAKSAKRRYNKDDGHSLYQGTSFDYDYGIEPKRSSTKYEKSTTTTTERPLIRYWNTFMRNVRLPTLTWNMTNPLSNLFNEGASNVLETPVIDYNLDTSNDDDADNKRKSSRKRKNSQRTPTKRSKKNRNRTKRPPQENGDYEQQAYPQQHFVLPPNSNNPKMAMYFYDINSDQYYEVQQLPSHNFNYMDYGEQEQEDEEVTQLENELDLNQMVNINLDKPNGSEQQSINDPDVAVVAELDEDERQAGHNIDEDVESNNNNDELLRSVVGSYMSDDSWNRKHQRANTNKNVRTKQGGRPKPRNTLRYYYLQGF